MPININITKILLTMIAFLRKAYSKDSPAVQYAIAGYAIDAKGRLGDIATGSLTGELSGAEILKALKEEELNLKNQLLSIGEIVGADLQELAGDTMNLFTGTLMDAMYSATPGATVPEIN